MCSLHKVLFVQCFLACLQLIISASDGGWSDAYRKQDTHGNYAFRYQITNLNGAKQSHSEHGNPWAKVGHFSIHDVDGIQRYVSYIADKHGFRAKIETNEPGTMSVDYANAIYNKEDSHNNLQTHVSYISHDDYHGGNENDAQSYLFSQKQSLTKNYKQSNPQKTYHQLLYNVEPNIQHVLQYDNIQ